MEKAKSLTKIKSTALPKEAEVKKGMDTAEFTRHYHQTATSVFHYLYSRVNNIEDAEDLTSQTYLTAFEKRAALRDPNKFKPWVFTIARNKANDFFRRTQRHPKVAFDEEIKLRESPIRSIPPIDKDRLLDLAHLIAGLHPKEQEVLRLRIVAQLPFAEIASILKIPESRIKKRYYRLLDRLQAQMEN
jgi:RNA polymerase sigma-70 factor (ECF subfamily)